MDETDSMRTRTVRELSGEIWAEIAQRMHEGDPDFAGLFPAIIPITDVITGVIARYVGVTIVNDTEIPAIPLPKKIFPESMPEKRNKKPNSKKTDTP